MGCGYCIEQNQDISVIAEISVGTALEGGRECRELVVGYLVDLVLDR